MDPVQVRYDFLCIEVRLGLTFLGIAQAAGNDEAKAARNFDNARQAHDALLRYLRVVPMTDVQYAELQVGIDEIATGLRASLELR